MTVKTKCPECGHSLRVKPGTKRTTLRPLFQCGHCVRSGKPADECEYTPAMAEMLAGCLPAADSVDDIRTPSVRS